MVWNSAFWKKQFKKFVQTPLKTSPSKTFLVDQEIQEFMRKGAISFMKHSKKEVIIIIFLR